MAYRDDVYISVKRAFEENSQRARKDAEQRRRSLSAKYPQIDEVERKLSMTALSVFKAATMGTGELQARIDAVKAENQMLLQRRKELLKLYGFPENYFEPVYKCKICNDIGFKDGIMCQCMQKELSARMLEVSGIGSLAKKMRLDNFDLSYYSDDPDGYKYIAAAYKAVKKFCEDFNGNDDDSLLFIGNTGTGKTHLSVAAAVEIVNKGHYVVYNTSQNIFDDFVYDKTHMSSNEMSRSEKYFKCELLVIDDLGTENITQFSIASLYNLINTRRCDGKSTIINTNLTNKDLRSKYDDRIFSRLMGEFSLYLFKGTDIRMKKLYNAID